MQIHDFMTCPEDLDLRSEDRARLRQQLQLSDEQINRYVAAFVAARVLQGDAGKRLQAQPDELRRESWLNQLAASVEKQHWLATRGG